MTEAAVDAYRRFIDSMVEQAGYSVTANRILATGHAERTNEKDSRLSEAEKRRKAALLSMTLEQREVVIELLLLELVNGFHNAILEIGDSDFTLGGKALRDLADEWPNGDFMARLDGYQWKS